MGGEFERALTVRYRFNVAIEDQLTKRRKHYIIDVGKVIAHQNLFNQRNELNGDGCHIYWRELDKWLEIFDDDHDALKPQRQTQFKVKTKRKNHSG